MGSLAILRRGLFGPALLVMCAGWISAPAAADDDNRYLQTNLVSDIPGMAAHTDPNLRNPWGMSFSSTSPIWVANNVSGNSTLYRGDGSAVPLVVQIPGATNQSRGNPTGTVFNGSTGFVVHEGAKSGPARFLFATLQGTISGWNPAVDGTHAVIGANNAGKAAYTGLAIGTVGSNSFLYAANFRARTVDVFDAGFNQIVSPGAFTDSHIPADYAPFGIQNVEGFIVVAYAKVNPVTHRDDPGVGHGFIDVFDTSGNLVSRFARHGHLNSPWGIALAPAGFGKFSNHLLIGNFGDGRITAFDLNGEPDGQLRDTNGEVLAIEGLWALEFGNGALGTAKNKLYFNAGINGELDGLFGSLEAAPEDEDNDHGGDHDGHHHH